MAGFSNTSDYNSSTMNGTDHVVFIRVSYDKFEYTSSLPSPDIKYKNLDFERRMTLRALNRELSILAVKALSLSDHEEAPNAAAPIRPALTLRRSFARSTCTKVRNWRRQ